MTAIATPVFAPSTEAETFVSRRSMMYRLLGEFFVFPDEEFFRFLRSGEFRSTLAELARGLPYPLDIPAELSVGQYEGREDFEADFVRLFEVGIGGPPCPLNEGLYFDDRQKVMEELLRFYDHFDMKVNQVTRELPDHICAELDFLHYLTYREAVAMHEGQDPSPYRRAQRDFLERHPAKWFPKLSVKMAGLNPPAVFSQVCGVVNDFLAAEFRVASSGAPESPAGGTVHGVGEGEPDHRRES